MISTILKFLLLFLIVHFSSSVIHTITPPTTPTTTTMSAKHASNHEEHLEAFVDRIEAIDVSSTQVIIQTSKVGPSENAKVSIEVIDLNTGEKLPSLNLAGILLTITRGRYTINFLKPSTWYGIAFRCEQQPLGPSGPIYIDSEEHLVKTHKEDGSNLDSEPIVTVFTRRFNTDGKSMENLVLTMRWEQHPDERANLNTAANVTLYCEEHIKYKQVILDYRDIEKSVEVKLDNNFEVLELHNNSRQIMASITPKHCPRICWNAELYADAHGYHFQRDVGKECESIETVTSTAILRDYLSYEIKHDSLTVHTNYTDEKSGNLEKDAYVQLTAIALPENNHSRANSKDHTVVRFKVFSTAQHKDTFTLEGLDPGKFYAVQYTYGKQSPFAYAESRRFIVETRGHGNSKSQARPPVQLYFHHPKRPSTNSQHQSTTTTTTTKAPKNESEIISDNTSWKTKPFAAARLDPTYHDYQLGMDVEPFCRNKNGSHFWLSASKPEHELKDLDLEEAICTSYPDNFFCPKQDQNETKREAKTSLCVPNLCYTASLVVRDKVYSMERRCVNVANQYQVKTQFRDTNSSSKCSFDKILWSSYLIFYVLLGIRRWI